MRKSKTFLLSILNFVLIAAILSLLLIQFLSQDTSPKIAYFDNTEVFSNFNLAKELGQIGLKNITPQRKKVDSLRNQLKVVSEKSLIENLQKSLVYESERLTQMSAAISNETNQQIWSRLNMYAVDFGKQEGYEIILGTTGNGNIMYAEDSLDITTKFIEFVNKKYEGE